MPKGYHHLTRDQRSQIYALKTSGISHKDIALCVGVVPSTISREIKRNQGKKGYRFQQADHLATNRRHIASSRPKCMTPDVIQVIEAKIQTKWSLEQISGRLKLEGVASVSHECIYQHIWANKRQGGSLYMHLRHHGKKYNRRSSGKAGRGCIPNRVDITERPKIVERKSRIGDWEGDTIIGAKHKGAIMSHVDRKSKFTLLEKLNSKTAENVVDAVKQCFSRVDQPGHTITYDNGKEFSSHEVISNTLNIQCYCATPYHSWERGLNEHTNGLVRQYFPKSSDLTKVTAKEIQRVEDQLNSRPRKVLRYRTPKEVFLGLVKRTQIALQC